jgi:hypothetical protein
LTIWLSRHVTGILGMLHPPQAKVKGPKLSTLILRQKPRIIRLE